MVLCVVFAGGLPGPKGMVAEDLPQVSNALLFSIGGAEDLPQVSNALQYIAVYGWGEQMICGCLALGKRKSNSAPGVTGAPSRLF